MLRSLKRTAIISDMPQERFSYLGNISDEDIILLKNVVSWAKAAWEKNYTKYSFFLDERQQKLCEVVLRSEKLDNYSFWGGYDSADRKVIGFFPQGKVLQEDVYPIKPICFTYRTADKLSHRDFLGSLMSMRIERDCVGDIIVGEGKTNVLVYETVAQRVLYEVKKIGRVGVEASIGFDSSISCECKLSEISGTVSSLRADCVFSLATRLSRDKAALCIKTHGICIDHLISYKPDEKILQGQSFSVKGYGKYIFKSINGVSKKDRIHITLCKFI